MRTVQVPKSSMKTMHFSIFLVAIIFVCQLRPTLATQCYECQSNVEGPCGDPFDFDLFPLTNCTEKFAANDKIHRQEFCRKTIEYLIDDQPPRVIRSCGLPSEIERPDRCVTRISNEIRVDYCTCFDDSCNDATSLQVSFCAFWMMLVKMMIVHKLFLF